jgi:anti-sigma B factor antagonist
MPTDPHMTFDGSTQVSLASSKPGFAIRNVNGVTVLDVTGSLVRMRPAEAFRDQIMQLLNGGKKDFAVNLTEVPYIDSTGVGALLAAHKSIIQAGGKCKFFAAQSEISHTLKRVHLDKIFELFDDEAAALGSFQT